MDAAAFFDGIGEARVQDGEGYVRVASWNPYCDILVDLAELRILRHDVVLVQNVVLDVRAAVLLDTVALVAVALLCYFVYLRVVRRLYVYRIHGFPRYELEHFVADST